MIRHQERDPVLELRSKRACMWGKLLFSDPTEAWITYSEASFSGKNYFQDVRPKVTNVSSLGFSYLIYRLRILAVL